MEKNILNEIESMKYLLGYKRGVVISEQDVDNSVDPKLTTSVEQPVTTNPPVSTTPPVTSTETPNPTIKMGVVNPRVQYLQQLLNDKFQSGLTTDGKYGPKTADAIYKNIVAISKTQLNSGIQQMAPNPQVVQPNQQITANANIPK